MMIQSSLISAAVVVVLVAGDIGISRSTIVGDCGSIHGVSRSRSRRISSSSSSRSLFDVYSLPRAVITRRIYPRCPADASSLLLIVNLDTLVTRSKPVCNADGIWSRIWVQQTITIGRVNTHSERLSIQNIFGSFMGRTSWLHLET